MDKKEVRQISTEDYLLALQKEYICAEIRSKIYANENDKQYFHKLMDQKKQKILSVSLKYKLQNIFSNKAFKDTMYAEILPKGQKPNFIYNIVRVNDKQLSFPYAGTVVEFATDAGLNYGITERVNFDNKTVELKKEGEDSIVSLPLNEVRRLTHQETDNYFWALNGHLVK